MRTSTVLHKQTKAPGTKGGFRLPMLQVSPYFSIGRGAFKNTNMAKARVIGLNAGMNPSASIMAWDGSGNYLGCYDERPTFSPSDVSSDQIKAAIISTTKAGLQSDTGQTFADSDYSFLFVQLNNRSFSTPSLAVNTSRQASVSQDAQISAAVDITSVLNLSGGTSGKVELKYADDSAFTTNVVSVQTSANGNTGTLTIGIAITQLNTATVTGIIPAGKYYRLVTTNVTGTPTYGTPQIQEVLL